MPPFDTHIPFFMDQQDRLYRVRVAFKALLVPPCQSRNVRYVSDADPVTGKQVLHKELVG